MSMKTILLRNFCEHVKKIPSPFLCFSCAIAPLHRTILLYCVRVQKGGKGEHIAHATPAKGVHPHKLHNLQYLFFYAASYFCISLFLPFLFLGSSADYVVIF